MNSLFHEIEFIKSFVIKNKQERYLSFVQSKNNYNKFLEILNHRIINEIEKKYISNQADIKQLLNNISICYIISDQKDYNKKELPVIEALNIINKAHYGTIISFIPGEVACLKLESPSEIIWLKKDD